MNIGGILLALQGAASQGILWGIFVLGVYITYKILDIADLTVDGSFALGGCVCATLVVTQHESGSGPCHRHIGWNDCRRSHRFFTYSFRYSGNSGRYFDSDCPMVY